MSDRKDIIVPEQEIDEADIFGRSKSREEILEELKAEKKAQRAAVKEARQALREQRRTEPKEPRPEMRVMGGILALVIIGCIAAMFVNFYREKQQEKFEMDETMTSYFLAEDALPEMSEQGLKAAINEAYYTKGGYLCVKMTLGNGSDKDKHLEDIQVEIVNGDTDAPIAKGFTDKVDKDYVVPANGTNTYTFYIAPEHVTISNDPLMIISYNIQLSSSDVTE